MDHPSATVSRETELDRMRVCTRCDGTQELLAVAHGMGSYRCDTCEMTVGFDLDASPPEFLLDRGTPARYTRAVFGDRLTAQELRLAS